MKNLITSAIDPLISRWKGEALDESDKRDRIDSEGCTWGWGCPCTPWRDPFHRRQRQARERRMRWASCDHSNYGAPGHGYGNGWWCIDDLHAGPVDTIADIIAWSIRAEGKPRTLIVANRVTARFPDLTARLLLNN